MTIKYTILCISMALVLMGCNNANINQLDNTPLTEQKLDSLDIEKALQLSRMPLNCILQEYPNKTGHTAASAEDILQTPAQLHPSFYGCFDWHSSVHGHWMLVRILNTYPQIANKDSILQILSITLTAPKLQIETQYFESNILGASFERTYGWAWLLKLDQELASAKDSALRKMYHNLQPLTQKIVTLWKNYLPKQTYPNKTGVHGNTAFAMSLAIDWAKYMNDTAFTNALSEKAKNFYAAQEHTPAHLEPDGADFFSPSLYIADLMTRCLDTVEYNIWFEKFFDTKGLNNICQTPVVSDRNDYQIVHLDGLMFSRAVNIRQILPYLTQNKVRQQLIAAHQDFLRTGLNNLNASNYGGEHWLGSFATLALSGY